MGGVLLDLGKVLFQSPPGGLFYVVTNLLGIFTGKEVSDDGLGNMVCTWCDKYYPGTW